MVYDEAVRQRFESHVDRTGECHVWRGAKPARHPSFLVGSRRDGTRRTVLVNRMALEMKLNRPLATEEQSLHTCDNPICVRPEHLYVGDHDRNMRDKAERGRGKNHLVNSRQFSPSQVQEIRRLHSSGVMQKDLAVQFGVSAALISQICRGTLYADIEGEP